MSSTACHTVLLSLSLLLACSAMPASELRASGDDGSQAVLDALDASSERYARLARELWKLAELGYQEEESCALLVGELDAVDDRPAVELPLPAQRRHHPDRRRPVPAAAPGHRGRAGQDHAKSLEMPVHGSDPPALVFPEGVPAGKGGRYRPSGGVSSRAPADADCMIRPWRRRRSSRSSVPTAAATW